MSIFATVLIAVFLSGAISAVKAMPAHERTTTRANAETVVRADAKLTVAPSTDTNGEFTTFVQAERERAIDGIRKAQQFIVAHRAHLSADVESDATLSLRDAIRLVWEGSPKIESNPARARELFKEAIDIANRVMHYLRVNIESEMKVTATEASFPSEVKEMPVPKPSPEPTWSATKMNSSGTIQETSDTKIESRADVPVSAEVKTSDSHRTGLNL